MSNVPTIFVGTGAAARVFAPLDWISVEYVRTENDVGSLVLVLPAANYPRSYFYKDGMIEVWRSTQAGNSYLDTQTLWMIRHLKYNANPPATWEVTAYDLNHLLKRRIIDYNPGNTFTEKLAAADDMGKQIVSENFGAGATDVTRSIANYLSIQANTTSAPVIRKSISRQNVFQTLQDIAATAYQNGTYLVFDVVLQNLPTDTQLLNLQFQSFTKQRGSNRTLATGSSPAYIGPEIGNITDAVMDEEASSEITRGISTGQGVDVIQAVGRANDLVRQAESPFALVESVRSASGALVAADLTADAQAEVRSGIPVTTVSGKFLATQSFQYGRDWNWGDLLSVQIHGLTYDCHVTSVHVRYDRDGGEVVEPTLVLAVP